LILFVKQTHGNALKGDLRNMKQVTGTGSEQPIMTIETMYFEHPDSLHPGY